MNQSKQITINTDVEGINKVLAGLNQLPHYQVRQLIDSLLEQTNAQVIPPETKKESK